jgi:hypothetical protein
MAWLANEKGPVSDGTLTRYYNSSRSGSLGQASGLSHEFVSTAGFVAIEFFLFLSECLPRSFRGKRLSPRIGLLGGCVVEKACVQFDGSNYKRDARLVPGQDRRRPNRLYFRHQALRSRTKTIPEPPPIKLPRMSGWFRGCQGQIRKFHRPLTSSCLHMIA